jgi:hypothetical protein
MKKLLLFTFISIFTFGFSQEEKPVTTTTTTTTIVSTSSASKDTKRPENFDKKNEFRIDPTYLVFAGALYINYERIINMESGTGISLLISNGKDLNTKFALIPYYRFYFGKKPAAGFYFEGFTMYSVFKADEIIRNNNNFYYDTTLKSVTISDLAIGFGIGGKWITNSGFVFELNFGVGRNLLNDYTKYDSGTKIISKGGISIGYRF